MVATLVVKLDGLAYLRLSMLICKIGLKLKDVLRIKGPIAYACVKHLVHTQ